MANGRIQNEDIKSSAELVSAGGTAAQLPNDTKIYVTGNSINKTLAQAIIDGDIATSAGTATESNLLQNLGLAASISSNILTVALKQSDGSTDPSTGGSAVKIGFRDPTSTTGAYSLVSTTAALSLTIGTAVPLGGKTATSYYVHIYALNNGGTTELFASLHPFWDEGVVQSTSTTGTSNQVLYGANARSNKAVRLIGRVKATWTSGTGWSSITNLDLIPFAKSRLLAAYTGTTSTVTNAGNTVIKYATKETDVYNCYDPSTGLLTAPAAGVYEVFGSFQTTTIGGGGVNSPVDIYIRKNSTTVRTAVFPAKTTSSVNHMAQIYGAFSLAVGDTIDISGDQQIVGGAQALSNDNTASINIARVGD